MLHISVAVISSLTGNFLRMKLFSLVIEVQVLAGVFLVVNVALMRLPLALIGHQQSLFNWR